MEKSKVKKKLYSLRILCDNDSYIVLIPQTDKEEVYLSNKSRISVIDDFVTSIVKSKNVVGNTNITDKEKFINYLNENNYPILKENKEKEIIKTTIKDLPNKDLKIAISYVNSNFNKVIPVIYDYNKINRILTIKQELDKKDKANKNEFYKKYKNNEWYSSIENDKNKLMKYPVNILREYTCLNFSNLTDLIDMKSNDEEKNETGIKNFKMKANTYRSARDFKISVDMLEQTENNNRDEYKDYYDAKLKTYNMNQVKLKEFGTDFGDDIGIINNKVSNKFDPSDVSYYTSQEMDEENRNWTVVSDQENGITGLILCTETDYEDFLHTGGLEYFKSNGLYLEVSNGIVKNPRRKK